VSCSARAAKPFASVLLAEIQITQHGGATLPPVFYVTSRYLSG
jgi:hypothetical protein